MDVLQHVLIKPTWLLCSESLSMQISCLCVSSVKMLFSCTLSVKLNGGRHVQGILRGFDPFMNLVVDDSIEMAPGGQMNTVGMVVST